MMNNSAGYLTHPSEPDPTPLTENKADAFERHRRKCKICRHPDLEDIEQDYRDWGRPAQIARRYSIDDRSLYRHLTAVGLAPTRRENLRIILDRILERGAEKKISGSTIIKAVRAHCCLTEGNKWVEPVRQVIHIHQQIDPGGGQNPNRQSPD
jgi:hypothetical protein